MPYAPLDAIVSLSTGCGLTPILEGFQHVISEAGQWLPWNIFQKLMWVPANAVDSIRKRYAGHQQGLPAASEQFRRDIKSQWKLNIAVVSCMLNTQGALVGCVGHLMSFCKVFCHSMHAPAPMCIDDTALLHVNALQMHSEVEFVVTVTAGWPDVWLHQLADQQ